MVDNAAWTGAANLFDGNSDHAVMQFVARMVQSEMATAMLVQVKAATNVGGLAPVGMVDVQPMVAQIDGQGQATPHGVIHNVPYFRLQGGANAVIIDPAVGDIGLAVFASHDISSVKANKAPGNPGSRRRFDWADGLYFGTFLSAAPSQYVRFSAAGIEIVAPMVSVPGSFGVGAGADGSFATPDGRTVTVRAGIITGIV